MPRYRDADETDAYVLSGAEDLVPVIQTDGTRFEDNDTADGYTIYRYRPRIEGLFARIERWTHRQTGEIHWRSISRENVTTLYGNTAASRLADPSDPQRVFSWRICESYDDKGNAIVYEYAAENDENVDRTQSNEQNRVRSANRYIKRILYGNRVSCLVQPDLTATQWMFEVVFDYEESHYEELDLEPNQPEAEKNRLVRASASKGSSWVIRPDPFSTYRSEFEVRSYRRCHRVLMFHHFAELGDEPYLVRATGFEYADLDYAQPTRVWVGEGEHGEVGEGRDRAYPQSERPYALRPNPTRAARLPGCWHRVDKAGRQALQEKAYRSIPHGAQHILSEENLRLLCSVKRYCERMTKKLCKDDAAGAFCPTVSQTFTRMSALQIQHVSGSYLASFDLKEGGTSIVGAAGRELPPVTLPAPGATHVVERSELTLSRELRWYLEDFLTYPSFSPNAERGKWVMGALRDWGRTAFEVLFDHEAARGAGAPDAGLSGTPRTNHAPAN